jgi:S-adenosylmethionine decarboxylase
MSATKRGTRVSATRADNPSAVPHVIDDCPGGEVGSHILLDLYECQTEHLDDLEWVRATLVEAARAAKATIVEAVFHKFSPWGISGVVVIAESHLAIHIWPERRYAALDVFTCGPNLQLDVATELLTRAFKSRHPVQRRFSRGSDAGYLRSQRQALSESRLNG